MHISICEAYTIIGENENMRLPEKLYLCIADEFQVNIISPLNNWINNGNCRIKLLCMIIYVWFMF